MKGTETFYGYEFEVEKTMDGVYTANCDRLRFCVEENSWADMLLSIDDIVEDLTREFGSLEEYEKVCNRNV